MNPYVFFVGCARSGNTLVQRLADAHPELAVMHGTRWIARWHEKRIGVTADGDVTAELVERLPRHERFKALEIQPEELTRVYRENQGVSYAAFVSALFDRFGKRRGKQLVGDKTPEYVKSIRTLHMLWPGAKFVHIIRDGRDVCLSVAEWRKGATRFPTWHDDPVATTAVWWDLNVRLAREAGRQLGPDLYYELRYEALVADAAGECARMCAFLEIPYDDAMLRFHEGRTRSEPGLDAKKAWLPVTAGLRTWRSEMPPADIVRFEAAAGDLLDELGYTRGAASLSENELERAARVRDAYANRARARGRPLPEAWERRAA
jgi:Sulfotransferase family